MRSCGSVGTGMVLNAMATSNSHRSRAGRLERPASATRRLRDRAARGRHGGAVYTRLRWRAIGRSSRRGETRGSHADRVDCQVEHATAHRAPLHNSIIWSGTVRLSALAVFKLDLTTVDQSSQRCCRRHDLRGLPRANLGGGASPSMADRAATRLKDISFATSYFVVSKDIS